MHQAVRGERRFPRICAVDAQRLAVLVDHQFFGTRRVTVGHAIQSRIRCEDDRRVERIGEHVAGVGPPLPGGLARTGDHGGHQHQQRDRHTAAHQRCREPGQGLGDQDHLPPGPDNPDDRVRVILQVGVVVVAGQVDGHHVVAELRKLGDDQVPVPGVRTGAVDQNVGGHGDADDADMPNSSSASSSSVENTMSYSNPAVPRERLRPA